MIKFKVDYEKEIADLKRAIRMAFDADDGILIPDPLTVLFAFVDKYKGMDNLSYDANHRLFINHIVPKVVSNMLLIYGVHKNVVDGVECLLIHHYCEKHKIKPNDYIIEE